MFFDSSSSNSSSIEHKLSSNDFDRTKLKRSKSTNTKYAFPMNCDNFIATVIWSANKAKIKCEYWMQISMIIKMQLFYAQLLAQQNVNTAHCLHAKHTWERKKYFTWVVSTATSLSWFFHNYIDQMILVAMCACGKFNCNKLRSWLTQCMAIRHHIRWSFVYMSVEVMFSIDAFPWK